MGNFPRKRRKQSEEQETVRKSLISSLIVGGASLLGGLFGGRVGLAIGAIGSSAAVASAVIPFRPLWASMTSSSLINWASNTFGRLRIFFRLGIEEYIECGRWIYNMIRELGDCETNEERWKLLKQQLRLFFDRFGHRLIVAGVDAALLLLFRGGPTFRFLM